MSSSVSRLRRRRRSARTSGGHGHRDDRHRRKPPPRLVEDGAGDVDHDVPAGREVGRDRCGNAVAEAVGPPVEGEIAVRGHFAVGGFRDGVVILAAVGDGAGDDAAREDDGGDRRRSRARHQAISESLPAPLGPTTRISLPRLASAPAAATALTRRARPRATPRARPAHDRGRGPARDRHACVRQIAPRSSRPATRAGLLVTMATAPGRPMPPSARPTMKVAWIRLKGK